MKKILLSFLLLLPLKTLALDTGLETAAEGTGLKTIDSVPEAARILINAALSLLGVIFIIMIILAGFKWMTASGDPKKVEEARDNIKNAVIGLAVVLAAYAITYFVFQALGVEGFNSNGGANGGGNPPPAQR
ncbi:MAG: hypothetical protein UR94_C0015G0010 [Parcubacteria group bacterium GW2011_GWA2_36_10]|nr:MAG: hypothetical protein UR94_C0015G0010 [Parcubacteria group bacterium GW2011_GWA2_36_10]